MEDVCRLCALATEVRGFPLLLHEHVTVAARHLTGVARWDLECWPKVDNAEVFRHLLRFPSLRHVTVNCLTRIQDHSQAACRWETLTVRWLDELPKLFLLPSGVGRVVVTEQLSCLNPEHAQEVEAALRRWGPGRLQAQVHHPPSQESVDKWKLAGTQEQRRAWFGLAVWTKASGVAAYARLLRSMVLPPGGGPHAMELLGHHVLRVLRQLEPLLVATRVRTLCVDLGYGPGPVGGVLSALPASVTCMRLKVGTVEQAREVLSGPDVARPLRLVVLLPHSCTVADEQQVRELCAARQPSVDLEHVEREEPAWW